MLSQWIIKRYYKTLGTRVINSSMSPPSLLIHSVGCSIDPYIFVSYPVLSWLELIFGKPCKCNIVWIGSYCSSDICRLCNFLVFPCIVKKISRNLIYEKTWFYQSVLALIYQSNRDRYINFQGYIILNFDLLMVLFFIKWIYNTLAFFNFGKFLWTTIF